MPRKSKNNKRSKKSKSKNQKAGMRGAIVLPGEYFGRNSGRYFEAGSAELQTRNSAYGRNVASSRGTIVSHNTMGPDLGPSAPVGQNANSGIQVGGKINKKKNEKFLLNLLKRSKSKTKKNQKAGMRGAIVLPGEYFGRNSGRYFEAGSAELQTRNSAYGRNVASSRGTIVSHNTMGPDLGPSAPIGQNANSGIQVGGMMRSRSRLDGDQYLNIDNCKNSISAYGNRNEQTGGSFKFIVNPKTNRQVSIFGKTGQKVLRNYLKNLN